MMQAKNITRHSLVEFEGKIWMIETNIKGNNVLLVPKDGEVGREIKGDTQLEVFKYPAQLAMDYISRTTIDNLRDSIKGSIIAASIGMWEHSGQKICNEVDVEDATERIFTIVSHLITNPKNT